MAPLDRYLPLTSDELVLADACELDGSRTDGRGLLDEREPGPAWRAATGRGAFIAARLPKAGPALRLQVLLPGDAPADPNGPVAVATAPLVLPSGRLLLCGDRSVLRGDWDDESIREVSAPPGRYHVSLEVQLPSAAGLRCLEAAAEAAGETPEPIGAYFRRTRPGARPPDWLALLLGERPHLDPGHEDEWEAFQETDRFGALLDANDELGLPFVDLVVRLEPGEPPPAPTSGWLELIAGACKPHACPLGLPSAAL